MITVFRRLRQRLLRGNRFSRYLLYALGEIVLVIIGILIAINLNELASAKRDQAKEQEYYCRLMQDMDQEKQVIQLEMDQADSRIELAKKTIMALHGQNTDKHELMNNFLYAQRMAKYVPRRVTFDFLIASGDISLLTDDSIIAALTQYYSEVTDITDQIGRNIEEVAKRSFGYESFTGIGYQEFDYVGEALGQEILAILPSEDWQLDPANPSYRMFLDNLVFIVTMNDRLKQHLRKLTNIMEGPYQLLAEKCAVDT